MQEPPASEAPAIETRRDAPGNWTSAVPLALLALLALMLLHACVPS
ncbi:MAG TPA: hypothetical protein VMK32_02005 [Burkholderiaceae bacterium]|nr:hypothetical protein [Burkholderiaceae bacterium]